MRPAGAKRATVVSIGGNAILRRGQRGTIEEQFRNASEACALVASLASAGAPLAMTHGNGPVVGNIVLRNEAAREVVAPMPLFISVADSEGGLGLMLQQILCNQFRAAGVERGVASIVTQVVVDPEDPAFSDPEKPIGPFYSRDEAALLSSGRGWVMKEDSGRGLRRVVPSPRPVRIVEAGVIRQLVSSGVVTIAAGGGGVPVAEGADGNLRGVDAVIDKDLSTALLAKEIGAERFVDLTGEEMVYLDYGRPSQRGIREMTAQEARGYLELGHFAPGSMRPKIEAAVEFLSSGGMEAFITSPALALAALEGKAGTRIVP